MKPIAYQMRPSTYEEIVGQDHLVGTDGILTKMTENSHILSFILYGDPGCGKTTIAEATCERVKSPSFKFNASTDNKDKLKKLINDASYYDNSIIIIDEIHRMKKDIQDYLLPSVENGDITIIGLTTVNPYHSVNPAIRSRCNIYKLNQLTKADILTILYKAKDLYAKDVEIDKDVFELLTETSGGEIRSALNSFQTIISTGLKQISRFDALKYITKGTIHIDKDSDYYYDTLSGLQKSIRGSDVDAALHYLAILLSSNDLDIINRRLRAIAYEDIGLANPGIGPRLDAAINAAMELGIPEARLPYSVIVIEMALSPKSNSAYLAIDKALKDVEEGKGGTLPLHLKNEYSFDPRQKAYKYPHDYPNAWVYQQYLPDDLKNAKYYEPKDSSLSEHSLKERYDLINKWKRESH